VAQEGTTCEMPSAQLASRAGQYQIRILLAKGTRFVSGTVIVVSLLVTLIEVIIIM
jgi:hypothetical protein